mmetsp:Transcript_20303/g.49788  ORF Transcript_20303/g.49788 Transcript_20303/m.49788 type:complete len:197 (-) Transcript_20303:158-748(-)
MRTPQTCLLLILCLLQYAVASTSALSMDADNNKNGRTRTNLRPVDRTDEIQETVPESPSAPIASRRQNEDQNGYDMENVDMSNMNMDGLGSVAADINIDEYTQLPKELFTTPISEWTQKDWILFGIIFVIFSCFLSCFASIVCGACNLLSGFLRCLSEIGCGACNLLNCLTCYCCYLVCCDDRGSGRYGERHPLLG